jgi:hypothetical protein
VTDYVVPLPMVVIACVLCFAAGLAIIAEAARLARQDADEWRQNALEARAGRGPREWRQLRSGPTQPRRPAIASRCGYADETPTATKAAPALTRGQLDRFLDTTDAMPIATRGHGRAPTPQERERWADWYSQPAITEGAA